MLKEFATATTSHSRIVYLLFLEQLLPQISKIYFKSVFMDAYFSFMQDPVMLPLLYFVKLAPIVRFKLDDFKSIEKLEQSLLTLSQKYAAPKNASDLIQALEEALGKLKDDKYLDEVQTY